MLVFVSLVKTILIAWAQHFCCSIDDLMIDFFKNLNKIHKVCQEDIFRVSFTDFFYNVQN